MMTKDFPQCNVRVLSSFLRGVRPCVTGGVRLSGSLPSFVSFHVSPESFGVYGGVLFLFNTVSKSDIFQLDG